MTAERTDNPLEQAPLTPEQSQARLRGLFHMIPRALDGFKDRDLTSNLEGFEEFMDTYPKDMAESVLPAEEFIHGENRTLNSIGRARERSLLLTVATRELRGLLDAVHISQTGKEKVVEIYRRTFIIGIQRKKGATQPIFYERLVRLLSIDAKKSNGIFEDENHFNFEKDLFLAFKGTDNSMRALVHAHGMDLPEELNFDDSGGGKHVPSAAIPYHLSAQMLERWENDFILTHGVNPNPQV